MRKKLLLLAMLPMLILSVLSGLSVNIGEVSAATAEDAVIEVLPYPVGDETFTVGKEFIVSIYTDYNATEVGYDDVWGYEFTLTYNPVVLNALNVTNGGVVVNNTITSARFQNGTIDNDEGKLEVTSAYFYIENPLDVNVTGGPGILARVGFEVMGTGDSDLTLGRETRLIGWNATTDEEYNIIDDTMPDQIKNGYFANTNPVHNVKVTGVSANETSVLSGELVNVTVDVENEGNVTEKFDVTAYYSTQPIGTQTITLGATTSDTLYFIWDTSPARLNLTISAEASAVGSTVSPETNTTDNTYTDGKVEVTPPTLAVEPDEVIDTDLTGGDTFIINVTITDAYELSSTVFNITWDPAILDATSIVEGDFFGGTTSFINITSNYVDFLGLTWTTTFINYSRTDGTNSGNGTLATITLRVVSRGGSFIELKPSSWWTDHWKTTPKIANSLFTNNFDVEAWKLFIDGIDYETDVYPTWTQPYVIRVNPKNNGFLYSYFNISVYENNTLITKFAQSLEGKQGAKPMNKRTFAVTWNITDHELGFYILKYNITDITPDIDLNLDNNELADTWGIKIKLPGDIDGDADVDPDDFFVFSGKYGTRKGDVQYSLQADMDGDGDVDPDDFYIFSGKYGSSTDKYT